MTRAGAWRADAVLAVFAPPAAGCRVSAMSRPARRRSVTRRDCRARAARAQGVNRQNAGNVERGTNQTSGASLGPQRDERIDAGGAAGRHERGGEAREDEDAGGDGVEDAVVRIDLEDEGLR